MDYLKEYKKWLDSKYIDDKQKEELLKLDEDSIIERFSSNASFGTGGIRSLMGLGTSMLNEFIVKKATTGLALFLNSKLEEYTKLNKEKSVVIAYDNRLNSKEFCDIAAKTLASYGYKVYIYPSLRTTPQLSFSVQYLNSMAGIMITASHNPKEYNGYKVYNYHGAQLVNKEANEVCKYIDKVEDYLELNFNYDESLIVMLDNTIDEAYYEMVLETNFRKGPYNNVKLVYSPSHGTGQVAVTTCLNRLGVDVISVKEQAFPSVTFENTECPNPEDLRSYKVGLKYLIDNKADVLIVTDPDCDRLGVCLLDKLNNPVYLTGNQMGLILADYILSYKKEHNELTKDSLVVYTKVTGCLIRKLCDYYHVLYKEVFTGFKNIAEVIIENKHKYEFGYEESYGCLINTKVRDKDAVQASVLLSEVISYYKRQNKTLIDVLDNIYNLLGKAYESQYNIFIKGLDANAKKDALMSKAYNFNLTNIEGYQVKEVLNYNIGLNITTNTPIETGDNLVKIVFEDDSFIAIRPSGTEPKVKIYFSIIGDKYTAIKEAFIKYIEN